MSRTSFPGPVSTVLAGARTGLLAIAVLAAGCGPRDLVDPRAFPVRVPLGEGLGLAEITLATRLIDFGAPEADAYLIGGWANADVFGQEPETFVWSVAEESSLEFFVLEVGDLEAVIHCLPFEWPGSPAQTITAEVNGRALPPLEVAPGPSEVRFTLPADALVEGRNLLVFRYGYTKSPQELDPTSPDDRPLAVAWDYLRLGPRRHGAEGRPAAREDGLFLPFGSQASFFVEPAAGSVLVLPGAELEKAPDDPEPVASGRLRLRTRLDEAGARPRVDELVAPGAEPLVVELGNRDRQAVEVTFTALPPAGTKDAQGGLLVRQPALRSPAAAGAGETSAAETATAQATPPSPGPEARRAAGTPVIVYLVDTLRADHLGCYGYDKPTSPRIDAFAGEAVLFEKTCAQSSWTRSSVASIFTSLVPSSHNVHGRDDALSEDAVTLAESLHDAGYKTAAFVANRTISANFGFEQGFDVFEVFRRQPPEPIFLDADEVNDEVFEWLDKIGDEPFFLYVHTLDPHAPYHPPEEIARRFGATDAPRLDEAQLSVLEEMVRKETTRFGRNADLHRFGSVPWMRTLERGAIPPTEAIAKGLSALYDGEIFVNDHAFGSLLDRLRAKGIYDSALILFVSDHGEEFHEHGRWTHGKNLYQQQLFVPMILKLPLGDGPQGIRVRELVQHVDILPTLLDVLGVPIPPTAQGHSILPRLEATGEPPDRRAYSHLDLDGRKFISVRDGRYKLICAPQASTCEVYDLVADPTESHDFAAERPVLVGHLRSLMRAFQSQGQRLQSSQTEMEPEVEEQLRALGYL